MPTFFNDVFGDIFSGMRRALKIAGISSVIDTTEYDPVIELNWAEKLLSWRPAGMILTGIDHHPDLRGMLQRSGIPTVEIWDHTEDPIDTCVGIDHVAAGRLAADYAVSLGYRSPAFVGGPKGRDTRADGRLRGIREAFAGAEMQVSRPEHDKDFHAGYSGTLALLEAGRPDVLFFLNDHFAFGGLMACQKLGYRVPGDIGIVGFNGLDLTGVLPVAMTTVVTPRRQMGEMAARALVARINNASIPKCQLLPTSLRPGATTRRL